MTIFYVSAGIIILALIGGIVLEALKREADISQIMKMEPSACPHGHLDWDDCPVCNH